MTVSPGFTVEERLWIEFKTGWICIDDDAPEEIRKSVELKCRECGLRTEPPKEKDIVYYLRSGSKTLY